MTSRKPAGSKRAAPPRACDCTKAFFKDWERLSRSGRYDLRRLKEAMLLLIANDAPLRPEWLDHPWKGDWADHREFGADLHVPRGNAWRPEVSANCARYAWRFVVM